MGTLLELQEGLKGLKEEWGSQLRLKKATAATSPHAPFPIILVLHPEPPDSCSLFDQLEDLTLRATIKKDLLDMSSGGAPAPLWNALALGIESTQLPSTLSKAMTVEMRRRLCLTAPSFCTGAAVVRIVLDVVRRSFSMLLSELPELLTLKPELLESYESVGATGNSERRIKFMSVTEEIETTATDEDCAPEAREVHLKHVAGTDDQSKQPAEKSDASCKHDSDVPQLHPAIQKMLKLLAARFPDLRATSPSSCEGCVEDKSRVDPQQILQGASEVPFAVSITPSDASWLHGSLKCSGVVALATTSSSACHSQPSLQNQSQNNRPGTDTVIPQQHSRTVSEEPSKAVPSVEGQVGKARATTRRPHVPAGHAAGPGMAASLIVEPSAIIDVPTCAIVNHMLSKEASAVSGKPDALRAMLKHTETHLATMVHAAWDLMLSTPSKKSSLTLKDASDTLDGPEQQPDSNRHPGDHASDSDHSSSDWLSDSSSSGELPDGVEQAEHDLLNVSVPDDVEASHPSTEEGNVGDSHPEAAAHVQPVYALIWFEFSAALAGGAQTGLGEAGVQKVDSRTVLVTLEGLGMVGTSCLEALRLCFQVACLRCTKSTEVTFSSVEVTQAQGSLKTPKLALSQVCEKCSQDMCITVAPHLVHTTSNALCHMRVDGCVPVDLLPCWFGAQCDGCSAPAAMRHVQAGSNVSRDCGKCHQHLSVTYSSASFQSITAPSATESKGAKGPAGQRSETQRRAAKRDALASALDKLQVGQPLPSKGTCKHYGHSHRWLRFPCCGLRFPCDLCHEELTDGHAMAWAKRMVCGYCSLEQVLSSSCSGCGKKLATTAARPEGRQTRFWEGGKGCRDKKMLDPRDKHKYRNSKSKTVSKRAHRLAAASKS